MTNLIITLFLLALVFLIAWSLYRLFTMPVEEKSRRYK